MYVNISKYCIDFFIKQSPTIHILTIETQTPISMTIIVATKQDLPPEIYILMFSFLSIESISQLRIASRKLYTISSSSAAKTDFIIARYGKVLFKYDSM
jgi:hypothetical protein